jgi:hypothetical protein
MFKRLLAWLRPKPEPTIPADARWVTVSGGPRGTNRGRVLVASQDNCGSVQSGDKYPTMSRQEWLRQHGHSSSKESGRAWLVHHLPDECTFL